MTSISHPSSSLYKCEQGDACEFVKHLKHCKRPKLTEPNVQSSEQKANPLGISRTTELFLNIAWKGSWSGIGAAASYLSGGDPIAGALFNPLTSELNRAIKYMISKSPLTLKKDGSLTNVVQVLTMKGVSMFVVASALNILGYPVTKTTLVVNAIPRVGGIALGAGILALIRQLEAACDGIDHMHYHQIPCPCPDRNPEIEKVEKFLKDNPDKIPADMNSLLQQHIEAVKQAIASKKDIKEAKEQLALQLQYVEKAVLNVDNGIILEK